MCGVRIELITSEPHGEHGPLHATKERPLPLVSHLQTLLEGVGVPTDTASWLIADVGGVQDGHGENVRESQA